MAQLIKNLHSVGDLSLIPGLKRSTGEGKGYPLQYSGLGNFMDCRVLEVIKSQTRLSDLHYYRVNTTLCEKEPEIFQQGKLAGVVE